MVARLGATVRVSNAGFRHHPDCRVFIDIPLPDSRLANGSSNGPLGRPNSWSTTNWSSLTGGGAIPGLGKPPLGRDPKSRARSRDYLKQCVS